MRKLIAIDESGHLTIAISPDGRPGGEAILPAPGKSEAEIEAAVEKAKRGYWLRGWFVESTRRVRNPVFDTDRKTSTMIRFRACENEEEARYVGERVEETISEAIAGKQLRSEVLERILKNTQEHFKQRAER